MRQNGSTALIFAAENGRGHCAQLLLDAGANSETKNDVRISVPSGSRFGECLRVVFAL